MKREIKFRGYEPANKEWIVSPGFLLFPDGTITLKTGENEEGNLITYPINAETLGQFTDIKDKNGKEIYKGDILRFPENNDWEKVNYSCFEVFFHDGDANWDYNIGFSISRMHNHGSIAGGFIPSFKPKTVSKMIVIGNIHENPELLNV